MEGPPLLDRLSGSAHGGLEYYRARGDSVHKGQSYLAHESKSESVHGGGNYWAIMRAAAAAARWNAGARPHSACPMDRMCTLCPRSGASGW